LALPGATLPAALVAGCEHLIADPALITNPFLPGGIRADSM
jgi:hypothetical protein